MRLEWDKQNRAKDTALRGGVTGHCSGNHPNDGTLRALTSPDLASPHSASSAPYEIELVSTFW